MADVVLLQAPAAPATGQADVYLTNRERASGSDVALRQNGNFIRPEGPRSINIGSNGLSGASTSITSNGIQAAFMGDLVVVAVCWQATGHNLLSFSDTLGNNWIVENTPASSNESGGFAYTIVTAPWATGGNTFTATGDASVGGRCYAAVRVPADRVGPMGLDQIVTTLSTGTNPTFSSGTLAEGGEIILAVDIVHATSTLPTWVWSPGWMPGPFFQNAGTVGSGLAIAEYVGFDTPTTAVSGSIIGSTGTDTHAITVFAFRAAPIIGSVDVTLRPVNSAAFPPVATGPVIISGTAAGVVTVTGAGAGTATDHLSTGSAAGSITFTGAANGFWFLQNGFEAGTSGSTIVAATSGDTNDNAFDAVTGSPTYSNVEAHSGSLALLTNPTAASHAQWSTKIGSGNVLLGGRIYIYPTVDPTGSIRVLQIDGNVTSDLCRILFNNTGTVNTNISGSGNQSSTNALTLNSWNRIDWLATVNGTTATLHAFLFLGSNCDGTTADEAITQSSNVATDTSMVEVYFGPESTPTPSVIYIDDVQVNSIGLGGPVIGGVVTISGTAIGVITIVGAATGHILEHGTAAGIITITGLAAGSAHDHVISGTAASTVTITGAATGHILEHGTAAGAVTFTGLAAGTAHDHVISGTAASSVTITGAATGHILEHGSATGVVTVTGAATGHITEKGSAASTVAFTGLGAGTAHDHVISGTAAASITITGSATGHILEHGTAAGVITITGSAVGHITEHGTAAGSITITGLGAGVAHDHVITGTAAATVSFTGSATGHITEHGTAAGTVSFTGLGAGAAHDHVISGTAAGSVSIVGAATGHITEHGVAAATVSFTGAATGHITEHGVATGTVTITGAVTGHITQHGHATGDVWHILPPVNHANLGVTTVGTPDPPVLTQFETDQTAIERTIAIAGQFHALPTKGGTMGLSVQTSQVGLGVIPMIHINCDALAPEEGGPGIPLDSSWDSTITQLWTDILALGVDVMVRYHYEFQMLTAPNSSGHNISGLSNSLAVQQANFIAFWRAGYANYVATRESLGATNRIWFVWAPNGDGYTATAHTNAYAPDWYPGDDVVDIIGGDFYGKVTTVSGFEQPTTMSNAGLPAGYSFATTNTRGGSSTNTAGVTDGTKPFMLSESGSVEATDDTIAGTSKASWMSNMLTWLEANPQTIAWMYNDAEGDTLDNHLASSALSLQEYGIVANSEWLLSGYSLIFTGLAAGLGIGEGIATGTVSITGAAAGHITGEGHATGTVSFTGLAAGTAHDHVISGSAASSITFTGAAVGYWFLSNGFESGSSGTVISNANSGDANDNAVTGETGSPTYSNVEAHAGSLSLLMNTGAASHVQWTTAALGSSNVQLGGRIYIFPTSYPTGSYRLVQMDGNVTADLLRVGVSLTTGTVFTNVAGSGTETSTNVLPLNEWSRIDFFGTLNGTNGTMQIKLFLGSNCDGTVPDETVTQSTHATTDATIATAYYGPQSTPNGTLYLDDIQVNPVGFGGPVTGTVVITGTAASTITITGAAAGTVTDHLFLGTATGTVNFTGSATGHILEHGTAAATITVTGLGAGTAHDHVISGTAAATVTVTGAATGHILEHGTAAGTVSFTGLAAGTAHDHVISGVAASTVSFTGSATGHITNEGHATGTVTVVGSATGHILEHGTAAGSVTFTGAAAGTVHDHVITGTAASTVTFTGSAVGHILEHGTAAGSVTFTGLGAGHPQGGAAITVSFTLAATGHILEHGTAASTVTIVGAATGHVLEHGTAAGTVSFTGAATGTVHDHVFLGTATSTVSFVGSATGHILNHGHAAGTVTFTGLGTGTINNVVQGVAASTVTIVGASTGHITDKGVAALAITVVGAAAGTVHDHLFTGTAAGTVSFTGHATGTPHDHVITGSAASSITITGAAAGRITEPGAGVSQVNFTLAATGRITQKGSASSSINVAGAASGHVTARGIASTSVSFSNNATGTPSIHTNLGSAAGSVSWTGTAPGATNAPIILGAVSITASANVIVGIGSRKVGLAYIINLTQDTIIIGHHSLNGGGGIALINFDDLQRNAIHQDVLVEIADLFGTGQIGWFKFVVGAVAEEPVG